MSLNPSTSWHEPSLTPQFRLRTLIEATTVCAIIAAVGGLHGFLGFGVSNVAIAIWALRFPHWQIQFSLVMFFAGLSSISFGCFMVIEGFRMIPTVLGEHSLPDVLIVTGPFCIIMGGFATMLGLAHFLITWSEWGRHG